MGMNDGVCSERAGMASGFNMLFLFNRGLLFNVFPVSTIIVVDNSST